MSAVTSSSSRKPSYMVFNSDADAESERKNERERKKERERVQDRDRDRDIDREGPQVDLRRLALRPSVDARAWPMWDSYFLRGSPVMFQGLQNCSSPSPASLANMTHGDADGADGASNLLPSFQSGLGFVGGGVANDVRGAVWAGSGEDERLFRGAINQLAAKYVEVEDWVSR